MHDPSLTLPQFPALRKTTLFCEAYKTQPQYCNSLGCENNYANKYVLIYLLTY